MEAEGDDSKEETTEPIKVDKGENKSKTSMELEKEGERTKNPQDQTQLEINPQNDKGSEKEQVMKRFLQEWRHLDERFIPEDQKKLYKNMFQRYKEKRVAVIINLLEQLGSQGGQSTDAGTTGKGGRK